MVDAVAVPRVEHRVYQLVGHVGVVVGYSVLVLPEHRLAVRREALRKPDVHPGAVRHAVPEPLVGHLVREDVVVGVRAVHETVVVAHTGLVLHVAGARRHERELLEGVRTEARLERLHHQVRELEAHERFLPYARMVIDLDPRIGDDRVRQHAIRGDGHRNQVGRCLVVMLPVPDVGVRGRVHPCEGAVRDRHAVQRHLDVERHRRLVARPVPAREPCAPHRRRVGRQPHPHRERVLRSDVPPETAKAPSPFVPGHARVRDVDRDRVAGVRRSRKLDVQHITGLQVRQGRDPVPQNLGNDETGGQIEIDRGECVDLRLERDHRVAIECNGLLEEPVEVQFVVQHVEVVRTIAGTATNSVDRVRPRADVHERIAWIDQRFVAHEVVECMGAAPNAARPRSRPRSTGRVSSERGARGRRPNGGTASSRSLPDARTAKRIPRRPGQDPSCGLSVARIRLVVGRELLLRGVFAGMTVIVSIVVVALTVQAPDSAPGHHENPREECGEIPESTLRNGVNLRQEICGRDREERARGERDRVVQHAPAEGRTGRQRTARHPAEWPQRTAES